MAGFNSTITGLIRPHMKAEDVTQRYHDSWNRRDADALVGAFIEGGTYRSPDTPPEGVSGQDFAAFVKGVWTAFPDLGARRKGSGLEHSVPICSRCQEQDATAVALGVSQRGHGVSSVKYVALF